MWLYNFVSFLYVSTILKKKPHSRNKKYKYYMYVNTYIFQEWDFLQWLKSYKKATQSFLIEKFIIYISQPKTHAQIY